MKNIGLLVLSAGLLIATPSFAKYYSGGVDTGSPLGTATPIESGTTAIHNKLAVNGGNVAAQAVLNGALASDAFYAAKAAIQAMTGEAFDSDIAAAQAIVEYNNQ